MNVNEQQRKRTIGDKHVLIKEPMLLESEEELMTRSQITR